MTVRDSINIADEKLKSLNIYAETMSIDLGYCVDWWSRIRCGTYEPYLHNFEQTLAYLGLCWELTYPDGSKTHVSSLEYAIGYILSQFKSVKSIAPTTMQSTISRFKCNSKNYTKTAFKILEFFDISVSVVDAPDV